jgi:hypothetical protein
MVVFIAFRIAPVVFGVPVVLSVVVMLSMLLVVVVVSNLSVVIVVAILSGVGVGCIVMVTVMEEVLSLYAS